MTVTQGKTREIGPGAVKSLSSVLATVSGIEQEHTAFEQELRISILRNYTLESMVPLLKFFCYQAAMQPQISVGDYDNILQEVLKPDSHLYTQAPDMIVVSSLLEHLDPASREAGWDPAMAFNTTASTISELIRRSAAVIVVNTFLEPLHTEHGLGTSRRDHRVSKIRELNSELHRLADQHPGRIQVVDWNRLVRIVGEERAIDHRFWYMYRAPFRKDFAVHYAWEIARIGYALKGRAKKVLVLDCDNTLWGGIVGEEGLDGIALDRNEYPGRCYYDFQRAVLNLIDRGVLVALCSKNNEQDVFEVLDRHPHCLLKRSHLAAWRINWQDKATNIGSLASEMNLGLDSFVFVDDSDLECRLVEEFHPAVTVLQASEAVYDLPRLLFQDGLFDTLQVSEEDSRRTQMYTAEQERQQSRQQFHSLEAFLQSLDLRSDIHTVTEAELPRVAQLIGKTNQFNLTTRRHTEARVRAFFSSPEAKIYTLTVSDRFGDMGLVGVLIATKDGSIAHVDTLLMSCRALGRGLERTFVRHCMDELQQQWNISEWTAEYIPTKKNAQVASFWETMGFLVDRHTAETTRYRFPVNDPAAILTAAQA